MLAELNWSFSEIGWVIIFHIHQAKFQTSASLLSLRISIKAIWISSKTLGLRVIFSILFKNFWITAVIFSIIFLSFQKYLSLKYTYITWLSVIDTDTKMELYCEDYLRGNI